MQTATLILCALIAIMLLAILYLFVTGGGRNADEILGALRDSERRSGENVGRLMSGQQEAINHQFTLLTTTIGENQRTGIQQNAESINSLSLNTEARLANLEQSVSTELAAMREENQRALKAMRERIETQLGEKLDTRLRDSFASVGQNLEAVQKGLGEMKTLASDVGDLQRVLSNVKRRGIIGEYQLGAIIEEILPKGLYKTNFATVPDSDCRVEFAVKLPGAEEGAQVWMPVDSKFPGDTYSQLLDAYDSGDKNAVDAAQKNLITRLKASANDIHEKYIQPPYTTEFGIMFLPFEGLYAEAVNLGMIEELQTKYKVTIAGPTTLSALLNSLSMGFRTLAIQKRTSEVWETLASVKAEFETFANTLEKAQRSLRATDKELDALIGTRTNQINRRLARLGDPITEPTDNNIV